MTKKILLSIVLTIFALSAGSAYAAASANKGQGQSNGNNSSSTQNGIHEPGTGLENPELKDDNKGTGQGLQNKNSSSTTQNQEREEVQNRVQIQKISISEFVEKIKSIAEKNNLGEDVDTIIEELSESASTTVQAMEKVQTRSKVKTFFFGSDYKNLGTLRSEMVQNQSRIEQLTQLMNGITDTTDQIDLENQIQALETEQSKISDFITEQEDSFSLFGWFNKLINEE